MRTELSISGAMVAFLVATVPLLAAIDSPSKLHPNIGGVSIESYNSSNSGQIPNCTESTVRACYQSILQTFRSQEASGVRFRFSLYQAMERSGSDYQVKASWLSNLDTFLGDIAAAGYTNVIPSPQFSGWQGEGKQVERVVVEGGGCPHGNGTEIDLTFSLENGREGDGLLCPVARSAKWTEQSVPFA